MSALDIASRNRRAVTNAHGALIGHIAPSAGAWAAITAVGIAGWSTARNFDTADAAEAWLRERAA